MKRRTTVIAALLALTAALAVAAVASARTERSSSASSAASVASCRSATLAFEGPLTGNAGFLGQEQLTWAQLALSDWNKAHGSHYKISQGDSQLDIALSRTVAQRDISNKKVMVIIGPSTSGGVEEAGKLTTPAKLAMVSPSATRVSLTSGKFPTFFRVVPNDDAQAKDDANYIANKIHATRVFVISSQEPYGQALGGQITPLLKAKGITVDSDSVDPDKTKDYSAFADKTNSATNVVFTPWQVAASAQTLSQQLLEKGKKALVFGTDGTYNASQFHPRSGYASTFAPDLNFLTTKIARAKAKAYKARFNKTFGSFGPASYEATTVALTALDLACADGKATRAEVVKKLMLVNRKTIYGTGIKFTKKHEINQNHFYIYKITNGKYTLTK